MLLDRLERQISLRARQPELSDTRSSLSKHWYVLLSIEMFYLNTIGQLFLSVEQLDQLEVCLPYSRLLTGIPILAVFQNLRWNSNKTSLLTDPARDQLLGILEINIFLTKAQIKYHIL